jgi:site-specific DNA-methyltransferase (adenine-specific)
MIETNKIYNIDCIEGFKLIESKSIDHVFTSPPYNRKRNDKYEHYNDSVDDYYEWICNVIDESIRVSKGFVFFNIMKNYYNKEDVFNIIGKYSKNIVEIIIWEKTNPLPASGNNITNAYEFFLIFGDTSLKSNNTYTKNILSTSVNSDHIKEHKAIMKQDVCEWFINNFTKENELILDCFMGAGTTAITCKHNNRNYIGFELNKQYVELSNQRLYKHLGLFF